MAKEKHISQIIPNIIKQDITNKTQSQYNHSEECNAFFDYLRRNFVEQYDLLPENKIVIEKLVKYFNNQEQEDFNLKKGIFLFGPVGTGKTTLMRAFSKYKKDT